MQLEQPSYGSTEALKQPKKPRAGRPPLPKGSAKGEMLRIRATSEELRAMELAARAAGQTRSEFIRGKLLAPVQEVQTMCLNRDSVWLFKLGHYRYL
jgi:hypothetical protein